MKFKFLPHTADIKLQAFGADLEDCFKNASYALKEIICKEKVRGVKKKKINVEGKDLESLLYNFLEEFLFLFDSKGFLIGRVDKIKINSDDKRGFNLKSEIIGDNAKNYEIESHIKAITYSEMFVKKVKDKWVVQVVVDV